MKKHEKEITVSCQINLHKRIFGVKFKNRARQCIFEIKKFAQKLMGTQNIRIDTKLNKYIWAKGPRNSPFTLRIRVEKKKCFSQNLDDWIIFISQVEEKQNNYKKTLEEKKNLYRIEKNDNIKHKTIQTNSGLFFNKWTKIKKKGISPIKDYQKIIDFKELKSFHWFKK
jgi:ribosomal protein L31E